MSSYLLAKIDLSSYNLTEEIEFINSIKKQQEEYDEFGQGYWKNISLYNSSGQSDDTQYKNSEYCFSTEYLDKLPNISRLIDENFTKESLKMVRARSLIDGMVIPHKDFVELNPEVTYFRVFIALEDNKNSFHSDESGVFQMLKGEVWFLDASMDHAAINFSNKSRMFLCLDYIFSDIFKPEAIFSERAKILDYKRDYLIVREELTNDRVNEIIESTSKIISKHTFKDIVFALSKLHFIYDVQVSECYNWIYTAAQKAGNDEVTLKIKNLKEYLTEKRNIGERFFINDWAI